ncbi:hypothetical protein BKA83DRAFT_4057807, partial [Pisolithus microcarpus]
FIHLICIFSCEIPDVCSINLAFVQPFTAKMGASHQIDHDLQLTCVKAVLHSASTFIPVQSIIHGAVLVPDPSHNLEFFIVTHLDGGMYLHTKVS